MAPTTIATASPPDGDDAAATDDPFGTTAIPKGSLSVRFDDSKLGQLYFGNNADGHVVARQPQTQAFATYEASKNDALDPLVALNGSLIDVNPHFVVYALKNGLIRVLHRHSAMRALLRGHSGQVVTDITFFHDGDTVATVGNEAAAPNGKSTLIVWRVYESPPEIGAERLLEITNLGFGGAPDLTMTRLVWHPFNPNQFWLTHSTGSNKQVATLVETTRIQTKVVRYRDPKDKSPNPQEQHAACQWHGPYCVLENALQLRDGGAANGGGDGQLVDLCWSGRDARNVLSVHKNGRIVLWDLKEREGVSGSDGNDETGTILPKRLFVIEDGDREHSRCNFLPHEQSVGLHADSALESLTTCFVTASATNSRITLWSAFAAVKRSDPRDTSSRELVYPTKLQEIDIGSAANPSSFVLDVCYGPAFPDGKPPSSFLVLGSRDTGRLHAFHVKSEWSSGDEGDRNTKAPLCAGVDYVVPFSLKHPVYSWSVVCGPTQDVAEDDVNDASGGGSGFDIKAFAYQSKAVQCLTVTSNMSLPPKRSGSGGGSRLGLFTAEPLAGPYVAAAEASIGGSQPPMEADDEPVYEEEEYDVDDEDDAAGGDDLAAAADAPVPPLGGSGGAGGGLFPGDSNPFANWLGAIAGSSAPAPSGETDDDDEESLPTPPAPSALPMPPGIAPPPGMMRPPPGMVPPAASSVGGNEEPLLDPLELLAKQMGGTETKKSGAKNTKSNSPKRRSRSPKAPQSSSTSTKKGTKSNNSKPVPNRFPDGKVSILKRGAAAAAPPPLPADPSVLSDPALLAAAGIPIPPPAVTTTTPVIDPAVLEERVQTAVEAAVSGVVLPAIQKSVQESFARMARPLHSSMDALGRKGVSVDPEDLKRALDLETPLKAVFADNLRNVVVPSLQSITGQVLQEVRASMPKPPPPPPPPKDDSSKVLAALAQQIQGMAAKLDALTTEVSGLRKTVSDQAAAAAKQAEAAAAAAQRRRSSPAGNSNPAQATQAANKQAQVEAEMVQIRNLIDILLSKGKYEEAFTKAVAAPTPQMTVYCCARSDVRVVLSDGASQQPVLSQLILLCLMQQLSAALAGTHQSPQELQIELAWLQEITLAMNPTDPTIVQHVPKVLRQLVSNVNARLGMEGTGPFRRPLQMLLNSLMGMQMALGK